MQRMLNVMFCMDGTVYKCMQDANFSPDEWAADWEDA